MKNNPAVQRFFKTFEVLLSFILLNFVMVLGSLISLFFLTPVLIYSLFKTMHKIYQKDFDNILVEYFINIKRYFLQITVFGYPLLLSIILLIYLFLDVNPMIVDFIPIYFYATILGAQLLLMYVAVSSLLIYLMSLAMYDYDDISIRRSIIIIFGYPFVTLTGFLGMFIIPGTLLNISVYFLFLIIPLGLTGYFVILHRTIYYFYKQ